MNKCESKNKKAVKKAVMKDIRKGKAMLNVLYILSLIGIAVLCFMAMFFLTRLDVVQILCLDAMVVMMLSVLLNSIVDEIADELTAALMKNK